ncbi:alpha-mannosidase [candidate division KSB1 bacterium]|nr:alpha-mannosidase [candidate division KSB1 bacterium]
MKFIFNFLLLLLAFLNSGYSQTKLSGLVNQFLVLGDFSYPPAQSHPLMLDILQGEANIAPDEGVQTADKKWLIAETPAGILDLKSDKFNFGNEVLAYAHVYLNVQKSDKYKFWVGSDDGIAVWVNGVLVHENNLNRAIGYDQDQFSVFLAAGWNRILCKVFNNTGGFALVLRAVNLDNSEIERIKFSARNPLAPAEFVTPVIPAKYEIRNLHWLPEMKLDEKGKLQVILRGLLFNLGNQTVSHLKLSIANAKILEVNKTFVYPFKREFDIEIPLSELIQYSQIDSFLAINLQWENDKSIEKFKFSSADIVKMIFSPIILPVKFEHAATQMNVKSIFKLDKSLKSANLAFIHPTKNVRMQLNGANLQNLTALPGTIPFENHTICPLKTWPKQFELMVTYPLESNDKSELAPALILFEPRYYPLVQALELAEIMKNTTFGKNSFNYSELLQLISKDKWSMLDAFFSKFDQPISNFKAEIQKFKVHFVGNAHIDLAWLWPWTETVDVCRETFKNALDLMEANPDFTFAQSQAQAYVWMEKYAPDLFERIKAKIKSGQWIIVNGMWTEPDSNLPSGEAFVRQILYGQMYFMKKFGIKTDIAWTPDTFGYAWTLPQIYRKAGFNYFVTNKIWWNDINPPDNHLFWWQSPDNSQILTFLPKGYSNQPDLKNTLDLLQAYHENTKQTDFMILYGEGDHGGGPTGADVQSIHQMSQRDIFPEVKFSSPENFFTAIEPAKNNLPVLRDEMYLEYHRGTYTTQAKVKKYNRQMECLLETAEKLASLAPNPYPKAELDDAWKRVLFNQFHDILPGSSIPVVYEHAIASYDTAMQEVKQVIEKSIEFLTKNINTTGWGTPFIVFNQLSWDRSGVVALDLPRQFWGKSLRVSDADNWIVKSQLIGKAKLLIELTQPLATPLSPMGYKIYHIQVGENRMPKDAPIASDLVLKNTFFEIKIDKISGNIISLMDIKNNREVLSGPGNELQFFEDIPVQYDAWNIGYTGKEWRSDKNPVITIVEQGVVRSTIQIVRKFNKSTFTQKISLYRTLPIIEFRNEVDWNESHVLVKAAFPLTVKNEKATYEIPYGWIQRPSMMKNKIDSAKFEVSGHKWIDLTDASGKYGVSLLNDCKYGFDVKENTMRITLLRSPKSPDPQADMGKHEFTYVLYPHVGDWQTAKTHQMAYELNYPALARFVKAQSGSRPPATAFVRIEGADGVFITTLKKAEERNSFIIRLVEYYGKRSSLKVVFSGRIKYTAEVDLLENPLPGRVTFGGESFSTDIKPHEIKSFEIVLE